MKLLLQDLIWMFFGAIPMKRKVMAIRQPGLQTWTFGSVRWEWGQQTPLRDNYHEIVSHHHRLHAARRVLGDVYEW